MSVSSIVIVSLVLFLVVSFITFLVLNATMPSAFKSLSPSSGPLNKVTQIGTASDTRDAFLAPAGSTLSVYIRCNYVNKTAVLGSQGPLTILKMGNVMQLQLLPGGASSNYKTQLAILTQGTTNQIETIQLDNFPLQTWVHLVIVKEGRRYTVYYNGKVAGSQRTLNFPIVNSVALTIGDKGKLNGEFVYPKLAAVPYRISDVQTELEKTSDTRHEPYRPFFELGAFKFGCPGGLFCFSTSSAPEIQPLRRWETPYA